jgi:DNA helicase-2/ATP-dependent DNA helicase PcrA
MRALIVDEVFDANDLDIAVIELAINAGVAVTLIKDPWQALYVFRSARPEAVPALLDRTGVRTLPLTRSFRWQTDTQRDIAERLRNGMPVTLPANGLGGADPGIDVLLGLFWKPLWKIGNHVLPLAFHAFKGGTEEAAATLLLNHLTRNVFSEDATYVRDALTALAITDPDVPRRLEPELQEIAELLRIPGKTALNAAYRRLVEVVATVSPRLLRRAHHAHTSRLAALGERSSTMAGWCPA